MTSKNLFFKLAKEDGKRRVWLAALSFLVFFFAYPIVLALQLSNVKKEYAMAFQVWAADRKTGASGSYGSG